MTCTEARFLSDVATHGMIVIKDDGIYRHLRFRRRDRNAYWFDIVTWPGRLCISGDMGDYVFTRLEDMFEFFRADYARAAGDKTLYINKGYWAEKLTAHYTNGRGRNQCGVEEFSPDLFVQNIKETLVQHMRENMVGMPEERRELIESVRDDYGFFEDEDESECIRRARDFDEHGLNFEDCWEWNCRQYTYHFIWCLYAIAFAIQHYDAYKERERRTWKHRLKPSSLMVACRSRIPRLGAWKKQKA